MSISNKIRNFARNNKLELCAFFVVLIGLLSALTIEIFTSTFSSVMTTPSTSRVEGTTLYVDDLTADYNYMQGLNYTEIRSTSIPSGVSTGYYNDDNLVQVQIIYDGKGFNDNSLVGAISPINNENINKIVYYKYYALERNSNGTLATDKNGDNYIHIELIDNPFSKRPYTTSGNTTTEYGFNGWVCNPSEDTTANLCDDVTFRYSKADYTRYMDIATTGGSNIVVHLNVNWYKATVTTTYSSANNISSAFNSMTMIQIPTHVETETINRYYNYRWKNNYTTMDYQRSYTYSDGYMPNGYYYRTSQTSTTYYRIRNGTTRCNSGTCYVHRSNTSGVTSNSIWDGTAIHIFPNFNANSNTVYATNITAYNSTYMNKVEEEGGSVVETSTVNYNVSDLPDGSTAGGFYYKVSNPTTAMLNTHEYYTSDGTLCTSTSSCSTAYKLIQYEDSTTNSDGTSIYHVHKGADKLIVDQANYYYLVTRDLNILRYIYTGSNGNNNNTTGLTIGNLSVNKPFTITGTAVNGTSATGILNLNTSAFSASNDIVIENIRVRGPDSTGTQNLVAGRDSKTSGVIYANSHNLKIGRNVTSSRGSDYLVAESILGGTTSALSGTFKVIVESGKYYAYHSGTMNGSNNYTFNQTTILGNDYDRVVTANNNKVKFLVGLDGYTGGKYTAGSNSLFASYTVFKSGQYGYNDDGSPNNDTTAGMYIGGYNGLIVNSLTGVKIEGGNVSYATGGYGYNGSETTNATYIGMSGGTIRSIYAGAGYSTTKGNRIVNVSGGTVSYSVLGGSDSYSSSSTDDGIVNGSTLIYVGGTAYIGGGTGEVQGVEAGSVFGAGGGNSNSTQKGAVYNSHIIINGGTITNSVYGGGNHGSVGTQTNSAASTVIDIYDGTIGNVFGGSKSADFSKSTLAGSSSIDINIMGGTIGNVYGGSYTKGKVYGSVDIDITGGSITNNVYGGGQGSQTFVSNNVDVTIGTQGGGNVPSITGSVYGGSALGTVNGDTANATATNTTTKVQVDSGVIGNVFGGGQGDNSNNTPYVKGDVTVTINNGRITNVYGGNDLKGTPSGTVTVNINGGNITNAYAGGNQTTLNAPIINVTGGSVTNAFGGGNNGAVTTSHISISGGTVTNAYGGGNNAAVTTSNLSLTGGTVTDAFGGGNNAGVTTTNVTLNGSTCSRVFGGSNASGTVTTSRVVVDSGTVTDVFGGNNVGGTTATTNVTLNGGNITNVYGGGERTDVTTTTNVNVNCQVTNVFGGSDSNGTVTNTNVNLNMGAIVDDVYGGNNLGGVTTTSNVNLIGGYCQNVYGGGLRATTTTSNVYLDYGYSTNVFGGGNQAGVNSPHVNLGKGYYENVFGGSNSSGNIPATSVVNYSRTSVNNNYITVDVTKSVSTINQTNNNDKVSSETLAVDVTNNTGANLVTWDLYLITSDCVFDSNWSGTNVEIIDGLIHADEINQWYGTNTINNGSTHQFSFNIHSSVEYDDFKVYGYMIVGKDSSNNEYKVVNFENGLYADKVFGGNNNGGVTTNSNINLTSGTYGIIYGGGENATTTHTSVSLAGVTVNDYVYGGGDRAPVSTDTSVAISNNANIIGQVYGGGNVGAVNGSTSVSVTSSNVSGNVFGGGNQANVVDSTSVVINGSTVANVYGGGNEAHILEDTSVTVNNSSTISGNVFGGGNNGRVHHDATTTITNSSIGGSVYAGGNGVTATVLGNNEVNIEGTASITSHVFGGGNAAATGCNEDITNNNNEVIYTCSLPNSSTSYVNIAGGTIGGNVYGGANTSVVYGETFVNIGYNTISNTLTKGDIDITGTVFGGGEANAAGSEDYDFNFISVTEGININIDGATHTNFDISGSIFGSGNASSSGGYSIIDIKNYGTFANPKRNVSIQRTDVVTIDNSAIVLSGAQDRTNKYKNELFTFSRIGHLKLKNGSSIFLEKGANLLEAYSSLVDQNGQEVLETVTINENNGTVTKNVDNRVYMFEGKNLNISDDESLATFGNVNGMSFFGMFKFDRNGNVATGLYSQDYDYGDSATGSELFYFSSGSYVVGKHKSAHNINVDGFYTNYPNEDANGIVVGVIEPTPSDATYYRWVIGETVEVLEVNLTASKYSTLGTNELQLMDYYHPNTEIHVLGVNYDYLASDINLLLNEDIPRYSTIPADANTNFGLAMKTGTTGWITRGTTQYTTSNSDIVGTTYYKAENSNAIPSFIFYLYHSKNISVTKSLGTVIISLMVVTPIDDLSNRIQRINVEVNMNTAFYEGDNYEATIAPGAQYELFANSNVNITNKSTFSTYFSLYSVSATSIYHTGYRRTLVSSYAYPVNTKITMIDFASSQHPEYYYFIVDSTTYNNSLLELANQGDVTYYLSNFIKMGSPNANNNYDDAAANVRYFDSTLGKAEEEFIFIVDLKDTEISGDVLNKTLLLNLVDANDSPIIPVLDVAQQKMFYNLYDNKDAILSSTASLSKNTLYIGQSLDLNVITTFSQQTLGNITILDTNYYEKRLGIKLSLYNSQDQLVNGASLLGVAFVYNGVSYYPRQDGTVRFNIAESIANVSSRITIDARTSNLVTGNYKLVIETFGSSDGIYYGVDDTTRIQLNLAVVNEVFGLDATMADYDVIIDKETGKSQDNNNQIDFQLQYISSLSNPSIRVSLYRRTYSDVYNYTYQLVDFKDYFSNEFTDTVDTYVYLARELPNSRFQLILYTKDSLRTGTYQIRFSLYDGNNYVGHINKYIIIE